MIIIIIMTYVVLVEYKLIGATSLVEILHWHSTRAR